MSPPPAGRPGADGAFRITAVTAHRVVRGLETGRTHTVHVVRTAVPVVFVPGIVGSRLGRISRGSRVDVVWDPDDVPFMLRNYFSSQSSAGSKRQLLIGARHDPADLVPLHPWHLARRKLAPWQVQGACAPQARFAQLSAEQADRGWTSVAMSSYRRVLFHLAGPALGDRLPRLGADSLVLTPVHAFGYNWTASTSDAGALLATYVRGLVQAQRDAGRECPGAVLVTHSMGGLVARAACLLHGLAGLVLGVVHGVQPSNGSAAAYWRMKAGFPRGGFASGIGARVLGSDGREVTALLGNMPGGLELLPNHLYEPAPGRRSWLFWPSREQTTALPRAGDPYEEIYLERTAPWRLVPDATWLDPTGSEGQVLAAEAAQAAERGVGTEGARTPWDMYRSRVRAARSLHRRIGGRQHARTVSFYGSGVPTPAEVRFDSARIEPPLAVFGVGAREARGAAHGPLTAEAVCRTLTRHAPAGGAYAWFEPVPVGGRTDHPFRLGQEVWRHTLRAAAGGGDGTVPVGSGRALCPGPDGGTCARFDGLEHEPAYRDDTVLAWTARQVLALVRPALTANAR